jgi:5,10-methylenetetrahydrofolate reductase
VDAIYLPGLQGGVMRLSSWAACAHLRDRGYETIVELSCAHENRIALQASLLGIHVMGLENVMVLAGDDPSMGDHHEARGVFDVSEVELLRTVQRLQKGFDMAGGGLEVSPRYCVGSRIDAGVQDDALEREMAGLEEKLNLGVEFFFTTSVYDLKQFEQFVRRAETYGVPVIAGVTILKSAGMARYINKHVAGGRIPEEVIATLMRAPDKPRASAEIASKVISELKGMCRGVNIISIGWEEKIPLLLEAAGL